MSSNSYIRQSPTYDRDCILQNYDPKRTGHLIRNCPRNPLLHKLTCTEIAEVQVPHAPKGKVVLVESQEEHEDYQSFMRDSDQYSKEVAQTIQVWLSKYFGLIVGIQDSQDFIVRSLPKDVNVDPIISALEQELLKGLSIELQKILFTQALDCDLESLQKPTKSQSSQSSIMDRLLEIAKQRKGS